MRYAIDHTKLTRQMGWNQSVKLAEGLSKTVDWYLKNKMWLDNVTSGDIVAPWADDNDIFRQDWDELFLPHRDKSLVIGYRSRWVLTRKSIDEYKIVNDFFYKPHLKEHYGLIYKILK